MARIIALAGTAGSGKSTVGAFIANAAGTDVFTMSLAQPMKSFARDVYAFTDDQLYGPSEFRNAPDTRYPRRHGPLNDGYCACCGKWAMLRDATPCYLTPRFALQQLGTEWGRMCYEDTWVRLAVRTAEESGHGVVIITDCRFVNEAKALRALGAEVWLITRDYGTLEGAQSKHASETEMRSVEFAEHVTHFIDNTGTLEGLETDVHLLTRSPLRYSVGDSVRIVAHDSSFKGIVGKVISFQPDLALAYIVALRVEGELFDVAFEVTELEFAEH